MSIFEISLEIERLRSAMNHMYSAGADISELVEISQELDKYIVLYYLSKK